MSSLYKQPPLPTCIKPLGNSESDRLKSRYPGLASKPGGTHCVTCRGKGTYRWYAPESRTEIVEYECDCVDQWVLHRYLLAHNVGLTYQRLGWLDLTHTEPGAIDKAVHYVEHADDYLQAGVGLIFYGSRGTGKTSLVTLLLKRLMELGHDGYFTTFSEMIDTYTGGWNDRDDKAWFHKRIKNAGALVLDDIGKEYQGRKSSGLPEATFDEVLRHRVAGSVPTIITTNQTLQEMQEGYGGGVMSLLHERSSTYQFTGEDFRDSQRRRMLDEIDQGLTRPIVLG